MFQKIKDIQWSNPKIWGTIGAILATSFALKIYWRGGICKIQKDLTGKIAVITGGNAGIGKQTTLQLVKKGCKVIMGSRDTAKSQKLIQQIQKKYKGAQVLQSKLDLSNQESIRQFAQFVKDNCGKIDFLINNAGIMGIPTRKLTQNGDELQFSVNHLGHFYLTYLLWGHLRKSEYPRITNVSSRAHLRHPENINFDNLNWDSNYKGLKAYGLSKLANILFTRQLQRRMTQKQIQGITTSLHPGAVETDLPLSMVPTLANKIFYYSIKFLFYPIIKIVLKTSWEGAQTTLYTILQDPQKLVKGQYYADCKVKQSSAISKDLQIAGKLWKISQEKLGIVFEII